MGVGFKFCLSLSKVGGCFVNGVVGVLGKKGLVLVKFVDGALFC